MIFCFSQPRKKPLLVVNIGWLAGWQKNDFVLGHGLVSRSKGVK
jgi:hypothetical protein